MQLTTPKPSDIGRLTRKLDLDSLRLFAIVCQEGSYSKAARIEPLTPSAISKRIAELERAIGCTLLERSNYGVRPTVAGDLVLAQWAEVAASLCNLMIASDSLNIPEQVQLSVIADEDASRFLVFDCLGNVEVLDDAAKVGVTMSQASWLPVEFEKTAAHAAVWTLKGDSEDERARRTAAVLFDKFSGTRNFRFVAEVCIAVVRNDHPLAAQGLIGADDLEPMDLVCTAGMGGHVATWHRRSAAFGVGVPRTGRLLRPTWASQISSTLEYLDTIPSGIVALVPTSARYLVHRYPGLRSLTLDEELGCIGFGCALRDDAWLDERIRLLERLTGGSLQEEARITHDTTWDSTQPGELLPLSPAASSQPWSRAGSARAAGAPAATLPSGTSADPIVPRALSRIGCNQGAAELQQRLGT